MKQFGGAWPALVTPFTKDDAVNVAVLRRLVNFLIDKGIGGLYVCGSTGEGVYMTVAERNLVLETVLEEVNGRVPVIAHVGALAMPDATALARHAQEVGADGIASIIPPLYRSTQSIVDYFTALGTAAPETPLLTYIFGGPVDAVALMQAMMAIPTLAGSKYTGPNMHEFRRIIDLGQGQWTVFSGMDEECLFAAMFGASGNIGSTLNYMAATYREIHGAVQAGDQARGIDLQLRANRITELLINAGFMGSLKAVMTEMGFDCGKTRLPNAMLPKDEWRPLFARLNDAGFQELTEM
ncbi:MAG TPA: dihydrodipicolinate synthase family protein [Caldilineaceae bacterium]|nr:dihydrodipicolinate synthase family protein [Caldilineaceae bacterium]